jgi:hypothetical protein
MIVIPMMVKEPHSRGPFVLVVVLEKENLDRMERADPADFPLKAYEKVLDLDRPIRDLDLVIAYETDITKIREFARSGDIAGLSRWIERGRQILPGDLGEPVSLREKVQP